MSQSDNSIISEDIIIDNDNNTIEKLPQHFEQISSDENNQDKEYEPLRPMSKEKKKKGREVAKEQQWFFGGIERGSGKAFMEPVMARNALTLLPILQKYVEPGCVVVSDCWAAYGGIENLPEGYTHYTVNHINKFQEKNGKKDESRKRGRKEEKLTSKNDEKRKKEGKIEKKIEDKSKDEKKIRKKNKDEEDEVDWEMAAQLRRVRSKHEEDILLKHKDIWNNVLKKADQFHEEKEKYLAKVKEEDKVNNWKGTRARTHQSKFDEKVVARGIRQEYSISPVRSQIRYIDEKEKKDKKEIYDKLKTKEVGTNTVLNKILLDRIMEDLSEARDLLTLTPTK
uniref:ISXO2-like transposase domain-containing protein n=1 Tax=Meloidogyne javanica TaxID=6303 RepID=A0A915N0Q6_MELJA